MKQMIFLLKYDLWFTGMILACGARGLRLESGHPQFLHEEDPKVDT